MITSDLVVIALAESGAPQSYPLEFRRAEEWIAGCANPSKYGILSPGVCQCCGIRKWLYMAGAGIARCDQHAARNPCAIEGCTRTTAAPRGRLDNDGWLCATHWRALVPPRSPERRAYHRLFRLAKKSGGWTPALERRFWRYWAGLVARARRRATGDIDQSEIARMFGWDDALG